MMCPRRRSPNQGSERNLLLAKQESIRAVPRSNSSSFSPFSQCSRSEEHTSELQSQSNLVCRLLLEKKKKSKTTSIHLITTDQLSSPRHRLYRYNFPHTQSRLHCALVSAAHNLLRVTVH